MVRRLFTFVRQKESVTNSALQIDPSEEGRRQPRTHLFVAATVHADSGVSPVNIRNMSQSGALIEAAVLPEAGTSVILRRGQLHARGNVAWRVDNRAGIKLDASVHVPDWMARQGSVGQQRVDSLIAIVRNDAPKASAMAAEVAEQISIETELVELRAELAALEHALIEDVILVATHPEIQTFDISLQRVDRVLKRLRAGG
jgi:hypothetical protein